MSHNQGAMTFVDEDKCKLIKEGGDEQEQRSNRKEEKDGSHNVGLGTVVKAQGV